MGKLDQ